MSSPSAPSVKTSQCEVFTLGAVGDAHTYIISRKCPCSSLCMNHVCRDDVRWAEDKCRLTHIAHYMTVMRAHTQHTAHGMSVEMVKNISMVSA